MTEPTTNAIIFMRANEKSPVVYGSVTGPERDPTGVFYRLENDNTYELSRDDSRSLPCVPRWAHHA